MLKLENVSKIYYTNGIVATGISKVNLELNIGEFVVITGESGSGKSTLLHMIKKQAIILKKTLKNIEKNI